MYRGAFFRRESELNFPHLKDTSFPDLQTADVYAFQNTFDYTRWNEDTKVKLVNVLWNGDYSDVVDFESDSARDSWFDSLQGFSVELTQAARIVPESYVKLPIPYDVMARYNYLYINMPFATSESAPLDYENDNGKRRWYFFVQDVAYLAPNSTQVFLTLDVWTNFHNDIEITYLMLERGHAPVAYSDTNEYLRNPIGNNRYLLAPDVNFDNAGITRSSDYVPFGNGTKYVCFASTCSSEQIQGMGSVTQSGTYNPTGTITYSDVDARYGHQLQVNGLTVGNGYDFSNATVPAKMGASGDGLIANNLSVYAIAATECYGSGTFFADVTAKCPQFLKTIRACFVVDESCITFGASHSIAGHTVRSCVGTSRNLLTKQLQKSDFKYPREYQRFAKLYTSPYAQVEITDNDGTTYTVNIEETSTMQVKSVVSVAFPLIDFRVYVDGIGGSGSKSYSWRDLRGNLAQLGISESDWFEYCFDWEIPTFSLFMDGETAYQLDTFNRNTKMGMNNAVVSYHNAMRSANTALENAIDAADTALTNVRNSTDTARTNAYNSADTGKTNADNSADMTKTNIDASADTMYTNVDNNCTTIRTNTDLAIANVVANEELGISAATAQTAIGNSLAYDNVNHASLAMTITTQSQNETTAASAFNTGVEQKGTGAVGGILGGASMGAGLGAAAGSVIPGAGTAAGAAVGALAGAIMGYAGGAIAAYWGNSNAALVTQANQTTYNATTQANVDNANSSTQAADDMLQSTNIEKRAVYTNNNNLTDSQITNNNANDRTNANNTRTTEKANATRARDTAKTNATNTKNTSRTNANNVYNTDRTNAENTRDRTAANSTYTRQVEELNAKELLENAANSAMASILDARNAEPLEVCRASGNATPDYMRTRGIQMKVKTQSDSAIRQTGDTFARFGYALNQVWDVHESGLSLMRHFTYWKASDIWINDNQNSNNHVQDFITKLFMSGITVWKSPTEIGKVSIYDN